MKIGNFDLNKDGTFIIAKFSANLQWKFTSCIISIA